MSSTQTGLPSPHKRVIWAPLQTSDTEALHRLVEQIEEAENLPYRTSFAEVEAMFARSERWVGVAGYAAPSDNDGPLAPPSKDMLAFGFVRLTTNGSNEAICQGGVSPEARGSGIGSKLLEWQTRAGGKLLEQNNDSKGGTLTHTIPDQGIEFKANLEAFGYRWVGSAVELRADLDGWAFGADLPQYVEITPWTEDMDDTTRRSFNRVNAELGAEVRVSKSDWEQMNSAMNRGWSYLALSKEGDRPRIVGLVSTGGYEQDWSALGWKEGVLQIVAVFESENRETVLKGLLDASIRALREDGLQKVSVTLDPTAEESAVDFYQRNGFGVSGWFHTYSLPMNGHPRIPLFD